MGRFGSNSVSAPLGGRRLPAIFPKRCNAGGQAGSSWRGLPAVGLPGRWLGGESGDMVFWYYGIVVFWYYGIMVFWFSGIMVLWFFGG
jgi:hypothetical protein